LRYERYIVVSVVISKTCHTFHITNNTMSYASQRYQQHVLCITTLTTIYFSYHNSVLLSMLWYLRHIVVSTVICMAYCCHGLDTSDLLLSVFNNMSYVSQHWQQYVLRITTLTTICLMCHNSRKHMSYASQRYQQNVLCIITLTTIDTYDILLSVLWYVWHIVVMVVIRKIYCCKCC
jgi:uncharacterized membrane protein